MLRELYIRINTQTVFKIPDRLIGGSACLRMLVHLTGNSLKRRLCRARICDRLCFYDFLFFFLSLHSPQVCSSFSWISEKNIWKFVCCAPKDDSKEGQLWSRISRRLLDGCKRGLLGRLRKLPAEGKACISFLVTSNSSPPDRKIRI